MEGWPFWRNGEEGVGYIYWTLRFPAGARNFSLHQRALTDSGANPASYPMDSGDSFLVGKAAGEWSWPLTFIQFQGQEWMELYFHSPNTSSWRDA